LASQKEVGSFIKIDRVPESLAIFVRRDALNIADHDRCGGVRRVEGYSEDREAFGERSHPDTLFSPLGARFAHDRECWTGCGGRMRGNLVCPERFY